MDRSRKKKTSNEDWVNPHDPEAEVTKMKDGTTHLAYKAEQAVDMETGAIVAVTIHGGATGDTTSIEETLQVAGEAVAEQIATRREDGQYRVHEQGLQEIVTDKGYHSGAVLVKLAEMEIRSYVSAPKQGRRKWEGKRDEQAAVYGNRRRVEGRRGKELLRRRGELLERPFAHQYETGAMRRVHVRGTSNVAKRVLLQAAACNLALILRTMGGAGTPRGLADLRNVLTSAFLRLLEALTALENDSCAPESRTPLSRRVRLTNAHRLWIQNSHCRKRDFDTDC
jgi:transposase